MEKEKKRRKGGGGGGGEKKSSIKSTLLKGKSEGKNRREGGRDEEQSMEGRFLEIEAPLGIRNPVEKCR